MSPHRKIHHIDGQKLSSAIQVSMLLHKLIPCDQLHLSIQVRCSIRQLSNMVTLFNMSKCIHVLLHIGQYIYLCRQIDTQSPLLMFFSGTIFSRQRHLKPWTQMQMEWCPSVSPRFVHLVISKLHCSLITIITQNLHLFYVSLLSVDLTYHVYINLCFSFSLHLNLKHVKDCAFETLSSYVEKLAACITKCLFTELP